VTVRFVYFDGAEARHYEVLLEEFNERYPHITVELEAGELPAANSSDWDVILAPEWRIAQMWREETIASLNPFVEQDMSFNLADYHPGVVELFTSDDVMWAVPAGMDVGRFLRACAGIA
jgi:ABC-type glycerol-3-phosphate transport system substrate-binding protein